MPVKAKNFTHAMQMGTEIFHNLKKVLHDRGLSTAVGDEGGFAPNLAGGTEDALDSIKLAVEKAGYTFGDDIMIALDCASAEFFVDGKYDYKKFEGDTGVIRTSAEQAEYLAELSAKYPIISIEDGMDENDWDGWKYLTEKIGDKVQLVGDDLFVTNVERLSRGIEKLKSSLVRVISSSLTLQATVKKLAGGVPIKPATNTLALLKYTSSGVPIWTISPSFIMTILSAILIASIWS